MPLCITFTLCMPSAQTRKIALQRYNLSAKYTNTIPHYTSRDDNNDFRNNTDFQTKQLRTP